MKQKSTSDLPTEGYVRIAQILKVIPIGRSTWWQGVKDGRFPQPVKIGPRTTVWNVEDIRAVLEALALEGFGND